MRFKDAAPTSRPIPCPSSPAIPTDVRENQVDGFKQKMPNAQLGPLQAV